MQAAIGISNPASSSYRDAFGRFGKAILRNRKATLGLVLFIFIVFVGLFPGVFTSTDPSVYADQMNAGPSLAHPLGTTQLGEDVYSQLLHATGLTVAVTLLISLLVTMISVVVGITAAYVGGTVDTVLSFITDTVLVLPGLPLLIVLATYLQGSGVLSIVLVLTVTSWAFGARQLRAQGQAIRTKDFLEAARVRGERRWYIVMVEIFPNMLSLVIAAFLGTSVYVVATMAGLQFLGFASASDLTWGSMLYHAQQASALEVGDPWWIMAPGLAIALLGTSFALLNYAFDEIANPALRKSGRRRGKPAS